MGDKILREINPDRNYDSRFSSSSKRVYSSNYGMFITVFWIKDLGQGNLIVFNVLADILLVCCGTLKQKRSAHENICMFILFNCTFLGRAKF